MKKVKESNIELLREILKHIEENYEFYEMIDMKKYLKNKIKEIDI